MESKDCQYCKNSYFAGGEIICSKFNYPFTCNDYELDDYFAKQILDYKEELNEGNR